MITHKNVHFFIVTCFYALILSFSSQLYK
jgi:hypothetical protein